MARSRNTRNTIILFKQKLFLSTSSIVLKKEIQKSVNPFSRKLHLKMRDEFDTAEQKRERRAIGSLFKIYFSTDGSNVLSH